MNIIMPEPQELYYESDEMTLDDSNESDMDGNLFLYLFCILFR